MKTQFIVVIESAKIPNAKMFLGAWNGEYTKARFVSEYPDALLFTSRVRARVAAREIAKNIIEGEVFVAGEYGTEHETWETFGGKSGTIEPAAPAAIIDVFSDAMTNLTTAERLVALSAWQALPKRPAYAYPSSDMARGLGFAQQGCWYVEGPMHGAALGGYGFKEKSDAYKYAGVPMYTPPTPPPTAAPVRHTVNELDAYIASLRNLDKKDYAARYAIWRVRGSASAANVHAPQPFRLSTGIEGIRRGNVSRMGCRVSPVRVVLTGSTCGEMCWEAREDICRCSCGGANHGCLRSADGVQPLRIARIDGDMCELRAVGYHLDHDAMAINEAKGTTFKFAHTARQMYGEVAWAKMRKATEGQVKRWPELAGYRENIQEVWRAAHPGAIWRDWPGLPYLLWVIKEATNTTNTTNTTTTKPTEEKTV